MNEQNNILPTKVFKNGFNGNGPEEWEAHPNAVPVWKTQPVMSWVESIAAATEAEERRQRKERKTISLGDVVLSEPTQGPPSAPWIAGSPAVKRTPLTTGPVDRRRPVPIASPQHWDLGFLEQDCNEHATHYAHQIAFLAVQIEAVPPMTVSKKFFNDYHVIQQSFHFVFERAVHPSPFVSEEEQCATLAALYEDTIKKLKGLIERTSAGTPTAHESIFRKPAQPVQEQVHSRSSTEVSPQVKKGLITFMTQWLRENWTNPYPDDDGLKELADQCGTTPTVVSNWLINARTRKWRPAIVKATSLHRPSDMLLEDSLCIFDGRSVRDLDGEEEDPPSKRIKRSYSSPSLGF